MDTVRHRALSVGPIRAFEAVARRLSFRAAADELFLTQPAISRQIQSLEQELGAPLFTRGTRAVALTADGVTLLAVVAPVLERLDAGVRQIRGSRARRGVNVNTFASFASLWLLPRIEAWQRAEPALDIRIDAVDRLVDLDDPDVEVVIRYSTAAKVPDHAVRLFGETVTPAASPRLLDATRNGELPPLRAPADLAFHTLLAEADLQPGAAVRNWQHWLHAQGVPQIEPRRWMVLNFAYQQVQAALAGQGVVLARLPLVAEPFARGELVELFDGAGRLHSDAAYWLVVAPARRERPEVQRFAAWLQAQAAVTREAIGDAR